MKMAHEVLTSFREMASPCNLSMARSTQSASIVVQPAFVTIAIRPFVGRIDLGFYTRIDNASSVRPIGNPSWTTDE